MRNKRASILHLKVEPAPDTDDGEHLLGFDDTQGSQIDWSEVTTKNDQDSHCFRWTPETTKSMLQFRFERHKCFQEGIRQKKDLWSEVAGDMQTKADVLVSPEACDLKYRNMLQTYKKNRKKEDCGLQSQIVWEYYDLFNQALKETEEMLASMEQERLVPSMLCESVCAEGNTANGTEEAAILQMAATSSGLRGKNSERRTKLLGEELIVPAKRRRNRVPITAAGDNDSSANSDEQQHNSREELELLVRMESPHANNDIASSTLLPSLRSRKTSHSFVQPHTNQIEDRPNPPTTMKPENTAGTSCISLSSPSAENNAIQHCATVDISCHDISASELQEYKSFGELVGFQLANVKEAKTRATLQFKIQELLYLAKMGKLSS